jgi:dTDP-4-dehydrorhamnose 3,5-epimerase
MSFEIIKTDFKGILIIEPKVFTDDRGCFFESFNSKKLSDSGIKADFVQDNVSRSKKGVLRGLHYQLDPMAQTKLLTVLSGKILDVAVDLRAGSPTFGKHLSVELSSDNKRMVVIPKGFAHGFVALEDNTLVMYKCDNYYSPVHERGIRYNDPSLNINWILPDKDTIIAKRDLSFPSFLEAENDFVFEE